MDKPADEDLVSDIVKIARLALATGGVEVVPLLRSLSRSYRATRPELASELVSLLRKSPLRAVGLAPMTSQPVDNESRLSLIREEYPVILSVDPILQAETRAILMQLVQEHAEPARLLNAGLAPTRTALFVGLPGVGKTLAARWLARSLNRPLMVLDLASVMSSLLGKTGENVRRVLDYAKQTPCVLLLDELDAVAKRRDDVTEIGELKRLVTVLLQEIDMWPEGSLLIAATNHADLLDPAVWRRFEVLVEFPLPDEVDRTKAIRQYLDDDSVTESTIELLAVAYRGCSYSDLEREVTRARRIAAMQDLEVEQTMLSIVRDRFRKMPRIERVHLASYLLKSTGISQRKTQLITGVSRDTLRKYIGDDSKQI